LSFAELQERAGRAVTVKEAGDAATVYSADLVVAAGMAKSRGEAKRLILQGAVEVDRQKVTGDSVSIRNGSIIRVGKRRWVRIVNSEAK
jgi:tyrosyl-tRNA synthetase